MELQERIKTLNIVTIGNQAVGKTSLLNALFSGPNSAVEPFQRYNGIKIEFGADDGKIYQLALWDTNAAAHQYMIRKIYYEKSDVILICFSVTDHDSLKDIKRKVSGKQSRNF
jgi:small GTP-binding protein